MGLASVAPPGPAIPVIEIATSAFERSSAPSAIAPATSALTAPKLFNSECETPSDCVLAMLV